MCLQQSRMMDVGEEKWFQGWLQPVLPDGWVFLQSDGAEQQGRKKKKNVFTDDGDVIYFNMPVICLWLKEN